MATGVPPAAIVDNAQVDTARQPGCWVSAIKVSGRCGRASPTWAV